MTAIQLFVPMGVKSMASATTEHAFARMDGPGLIAHFHNAQATAMNMELVLIGHAFATEVGWELIAH